jgi:threonine dehydrogenase-like Zn-dependent dehydrogenase
VKALVYSRDVPKFAAAALLSRIAPTRAHRAGPLHFDEFAHEPHLPSPGWVHLRPRLSGICGSDLATVQGTSSRYFEPIVSFPFVPGHEVVADTDDGKRVVLEPVLGCVTRGITPPCGACAVGDLGRCERLTFGELSPGLQSGFCCDTGGGWSTRMVAHPSQLHVVPDALTDEDAVMVEPTACAVHAALSPGLLGGVNGGAIVVVIGAGTIGLLTISALSTFNPVSQLIVGARHPEQQRLALGFGATTVVDPSALARVVRRASGSLAIGDGGIEQLTGGADVVFDCVGSSESIGQALQIVRPGGTVVLVGMPAVVTVDLTSLWHREVKLMGAYAYGTETALKTKTKPARRTFDLAFELVAKHQLGKLVSATYPLNRHEDAIDHALHAGKRGASKICFDLRQEKQR